MNEENMIYMHNKILFSHKKKEIPPFAMTQIKLKGIMLSEIGQRKTDTV